MWNLNLKQKEAYVEGGKGQGVASKAPRHKKAVSVHVYENRENKRGIVYALW